MFRFLERAEVDELHLDSLKAYGGAAGTRDDGLVDSALGSAINTALYGNGDAFDVAAVYAFHIAQAQASLATRAMPWARAISPSAAATRSALPSSRAASR